MIEEMHCNVGMILDALRAAGVEKNTVVMFASDNGYACWGNWNTGGRWGDDPFFQHKGPWDRGKFVNANGGLVVPAILPWTGTLPPGHTNRALSFYDFMATCADLAGTGLPGPTDGMSSAPLLKGRPEEIPLRAELFFPNEAGGSVQSQSPLHKDAVLLDERWFAYSEPGPSEAGSVPIRVFDVSRDPGCKMELGGDQPNLAARARVALSKTGH
jgi:arylsulfatase A-like enzyme